MTVHRELLAAIKENKSADVEIEGYRCLLISSYIERRWFYSLFICDSDGVPHLSNSGFGQSLSLYIRQWEIGERYIASHGAFPMLMKKYGL